jgi:hypothetical protein
VRKAVVAHAQRLLQRLLDEAGGEDEEEGEEDAERGGDGAEHARAEAVQAEAGAAGQPEGT